MLPDESNSAIHVVFHPSALPSRRVQLILNALSGQQFVINGFRASTTGRRNPPRVEIFVARVGSRSADALSEQFSGLVGAGGKVLVILDGRDKHALTVSIRSGASGVLLADDAVEDFRRAIDAIARGEAWVAPRLATLFMAQAASPRAQSEAAWSPDRLTDREHDVLKLLKDGRSNASIASALHVSVSTVKYHVSNLLRKLDCRDRAELVAAAHRTHHP